eukprot:7288621-Prymnesium_polylepis.2
MPPTPDRRPSSRQWPCQPPRTASRSEASREAFLLVGVEPAERACVAHAHRRRCVRLSRGAVPGAGGVCSARGASRVARLAKPEPCARTGEPMGWTQLADLNLPKPPRWPMADVVAKGGIGRLR